MKATFTLARILGFIAAGTAASLWFVMVVVNPYSGSGATIGTWIEAAVFVGLSGYAIYGLWKIRPLRVALVAVLSFIPVGFYMLLTPGVFKLIGISNLALLFAAVAVHQSRPALEGASALS